MRRQGLLVLLLLVAAASAQQTGHTAQKAPRKVPVTVKPECAEGAICFEGEVRAGEKFRKALNGELEFVITLPGGLDIVARRPDGSCTLSSWIANPPLMAHHPTEIDANYGWTAENELQDPVREFKIVENCRQFQSLYDLIYNRTKSDAGKYFEVLGSLPGTGRLWITGSRVAHDHDHVPDGPQESIEWLRFAVEIRLPAN